ncbi:unnamed protein product [Allacma fusca]|uniref:MAGUK p55 subfamily member 6 n=1 Tax=Allacma fusca TaxID=39272 RepID=A0A8J2JF94_9HEXA|nr:unnamed protein product [Allacma fusca]
MFTAFQTVRNHIASLDEQSTDLIFLKTLMESPVMAHLLKVQDKLESNIPELIPVGTGNTTLCSDICQRYDRSYRKDAKELTSLLRNRDFKELLKAHDMIAEKYLETSSGTPWEERKSGEKELRDVDQEDETNVIYSEPIRVIGLRKSHDQPLGVTVEEQDGCLVVARIISGGMIDRLGLLKIGDVIIEVNTNKVDTPDKLQQEIAKARDSLQLKVASPSEDKPNFGLGQCFMRALFAYDPALDTLLPCKEIGLGFHMGDILHIVDQSDPNWWQAKKVGESCVGLIPSRELEERRAAFVRPEADFIHSIGVCGARISRKKKKCVYTAKQNSEFDRAELVLYEEVTRMPPFRRKTLVLVGTNGVGRRTLKNRLINSDPYKFGCVVPITSRPPREGEEQMNIYTFISREDFEEGIRNNRFLEFGERDGCYYGTSFDSVREVIRQGKLCIIDCGPSILKILHNSPEFMPYVVFLSAPGAERLQQQDDFERQHGFSSRPISFDRTSSIRYSSRRARTLESIASLYEEDDVRQTVEDSQSIQRLYSPYFDLVVVNEDFDETFRRVVQAIDSLNTDYQWVPVSWVY